MKTAARWFVYVVISLLILGAYEGLVQNPAGRWQLVGGNGNGYAKMDTTTGEVWVFSGDTKGWELLRGPIERK